MTHLKLHIAGMGLVSPMALTAEQHVAFARADATMATTGAFLGPDGDPLDALYCAWIDPRADQVTRLTELAARAINDAVGHAASRVPTVLITAHPRAFDTADVPAAVTDALADQPLTVAARLRGSAAVAEALTIANKLTRQHERVLVLAVDTFITPSALAERVEQASEWLPSAPPWSEAAAAMCVSSQPSEPHAPRITWCGSGMASSCDDNDEPVDGRALTALLRQSATLLPHSHGPSAVDSLREHSWRIAAARCHDLLGVDHEEHSIESRAGIWGAASGVGNLVMALAQCPARAAAWSVSADGLRSLCITERRA